MTRVVILAVDAGGTSFKYALLNDENYSIIGKEQFYPISSFGTKEELLGSFFRLFKDAQKQCDELSLTLSRVALSVPGPFDCARGVSLMKHKWLALKDVPLIDVFSTWRKDIPYSFLPDVHAFLLGEKYFGEAKDDQSTAAIIIGTGVGFGMWDGKRFIADSLGLPKIGIYKIPYHDGVLEDFVSGRGVSASYERKTGKVISAKDIEDLARKGDVVSRLVYEDMGAVLGSIVGGILSEYGMQAVVFGGRLSLAFDFFGQSFSRAICAEEKHIKVYQSHMLEHAAMKGVALWAKRMC